tara:strand:- start:121 stop:513 length:393 start_codon:yes stop_codon:yes gene_type:complete
MENLKQHQEYVDWALSYAKNKNYHSAAQAIADYRSASLGMLRLQAECSGCDWCCGGGNEQYRMYSTMQDTALAYLKSIGTPPGDLPKLCDLCGYHDAKTQTENGVFDVCYKCRYSTEVYNAEQRKESNDE